MQIQKKYKDKATDPKCWQTFIRPPLTTLLLFTLRSLFTLFILFCLLFHLIFLHSVCLNNNFISLYKWNSKDVMKTAKPYVFLPSYINVSYFNLWNSQNQFKMSTNSPVPCDRIINLMKTLLYLFLES